MKRLKKAKKQLRQAKKLEAKKPLTEKLPYLPIKIDVPMISG